MRTVGGVEALPPPAEVAFAASCIRALPPALPGVAAKVRHAWVGLLARALFEARAGEMGEAEAVRAAQALEQSMYREARRGVLLGISLVPTVEERQSAEGLTYMASAKRIHAALQTNGPRLLELYGDDLSILPALTTDHLIVGTHEAAWRQRKDEDQAHAQRVLKDEGTKRHVVEGLVRCSGCFSYDVSVQTQQTRSQDEPADLVWCCNACGKGGRQRG